MAMPTGVVTTGGAGTVTGTVAPGGGTGTGTVTGMGGDAATGAPTGTGGAGTVTGDGTAGVGTAGAGTAGAAPTGSEPVVLPPLVTSAQGAYWQPGEWTEGGGGNADVTVNETSANQTWEGWGGTFNEKGWEALKSVSDEDRALAIRLLFDRQEGAGFTYGRIPVGSSDYGNSRYSLNETAGDTEMASFSIDRDLIDLIPYIKAALAVNPDIRFWGSPWSPPTWMKSGGGFDGGSMNSQHFGAHALYLARWIEEYNAQGIHIEAIHPQNEPGFTQDYPSCSWSSGQYVEYIGQHLGPLLEQRGLDTEIWVGTMSNTSVGPGIVSAVMADGTASQYIKGIGLQWGMVSRAAEYGRNYGLHVMQTEHQCGNNPWETPGTQNRAPNDHAYGVETWGRFKNWIVDGNVNSYLAWNMVLDTGGRSLDTQRPWAQNALLAVDTGSGQLIQTPAYFVFRHLAAYVYPGAVRLSTSGGDAIAFRNPDESIVVAIYNSGGARDMTVGVGGTTLQFSAPGSGWATVMYPAAQ